MVPKYNIHYVYVCAYKHIFTLSVWRSEDNGGVCVPRCLCGGQRTIYIELVLFPLHGSQECTEWGVG